MPGVRQVPGVFAVALALSACVASNTPVEQPTPLPSPPSTTTPGEGPTPTPATQTPVTATPDSPTPVAPTPATPTPVTATPDSPTPVTPTPVTATPSTPPPDSPTPSTPTPDSPTPPSPTPDSPTPRAEPDALALNEVDCQNRDWIELVNFGSTPIDLTGYVLTDEPDDLSHRYALPGETLAPYAFWVVKQETSDEAGFSFGLQCGSETLTLLRPDGSTQDAVALPAVDDGHTVGRMPDGTGGWQETEPTQGDPNQPAIFEGDASEWIYDPFQVLDFSLSLSQEAIDALAIDPYSYVPAGFVGPDGEGGEVTLDVGVRIKGQYGSYRTLDQKAAFLVRFDEYVPDQTYFGLEKLTLNNMVQDASMIHEALAYRIFAASDVPAPRLGYAWIKVNGQDYGLYLNLETYDSPFLRQHFDSTQHLYEGAYGTDVYPGYAFYFEVDEGDETIRADFEALAQTSYYVDDARWMDSVSKLADLPSMLRMWAVEQYVGHWDGYAETVNNFYLHSDDDGYFTMLPSGVDQTFSSYLSFYGGYSALFTHCLRIPECKLAYQKTVESLLPVVDSLALDPYAESLAAFLRPYEALDPRREYSLDDIDWSVAATRSFLSGRYPDAQSWVSCELYDDCPPCLEAWNGSHRYLICNHLEDHAGATEACQEQGSELLKVDSAGEQNWVLSVVGSTVGAADVWMGLSDVDSEGTFTWWDGSPLEFTAWSGGQPDNYGDEDCAELLWGGTWNDLPCTYSLYAVCEDPCPDGQDEDGDGYEACGNDCNDSDATTHPGAFDLCNDGIDQDCNGTADDGEGCTDCISQIYNDHLYLLCTRGRTWEASREWCQSQGTDLVILDSFDEQIWAWQAFGALTSLSTVWIGLNDLDQEGQFVYWDGSTPAFTAWNGGEPNNVGEEDCVQLFDGTLWNDLACGYELPALCEAPVSISTVQP